MCRKCQYLSSSMGHTLESYGTLICFNFFYVSVVSTAFHKHVSDVFPNQT